MENKVFNPTTLEAFKEIDPEGWRNLAFEILTLFLSTVPDQLEQLKVAQSHQEWEQVQKLAHTMKSSCGNIGADACYRLFQKIEINASHKNPKACEECFQQLYPVFEESMKFILEFKQRLIPN